MHIIKFDINKSTTFYLTQTGCLSAYTITIKFINECEYFLNRQLDKAGYKFLI